MTQCPVLSVSRRLSGTNVLRSALHANTRALNAESTSTLVLHAAGRGNYPQVVPRRTFHSSQALHAKRLRGSSGRKSSARPSKRTTSVSDNMGEEQRASEGAANWHAYQELTSASSQQSASRAPPSNLFIDSNFAPETMQNAQDTSGDHSSTVQVKKKAGKRKSLDAMLQRAEMNLRKQIQEFSSDPAVKDLLSQLDALNSSTRKSKSISKSKRPSDSSNSKDIMAFSSVQEVPKPSSSTITSASGASGASGVSSVGNKLVEDEVPSHTHHAHHPSASESEYRDFFTTKVERKGLEESNRSQATPSKRRHDEMKQRKRPQDREMIEGNFESRSDKASTRRIKDTSLPESGKKRERTHLEDEDKANAISNRKAFEKMEISDDWIKYVMKFGPAKYIQKSGYNQDFRKLLPYRADVLTEDGSNRELFPEDHPLHEKFSSNLDVFYNPKTGVRNDRRHVALSIKAKEKLFYSMQDVSPLLSHVFTNVPLKKICEATTPEEIPQENPNSDNAKVLPNECIVCGRSNVGKSSIINALIGRPVMLTSPKPGKTQSLHFYRLGQVLTLVDLPGYGFAYEVEEELVQKWSNTIDYYIRNRGEKLKMVYLIVDSRHGLKVNDLAMIRNLIEARVEFSIVFSKTDLEFPDILAKRLYLSCKAILEIMESLQKEGIYTGKIPSMEEMREKFFFCSSITLSGVGKLRSSMEPFMNLKKVAKRYNAEKHPKPKFLQLRHRDEL